MVSTSALELGIDIGNLDLCVLVGYPGTIMSTWQRAGRVGRDGKDSAMILIAHDDALEYKGKLLRSRQGDIWYSTRKSPHREVNRRGTGNTIPIFLEKIKENIKVEHKKQLISTPLGKSESRYGVLDIETRRSAREVGGWNKAERMGVSCAVLYDSGSDEFFTYLQDQMDELIQHLQKLDLIIGFNIVQFDYKVLSGLSQFDFYSLPSLDLLLKVHEILGYRLSLDHLTQQTLGTKKSADGLMALQWWKQGEMDKIITYCTQDVRVTRDLYEFGKKNHFLLFENKADQQVRIPVQW